MEDHCPADAMQGPTVQSNMGNLLFSLYPERFQRTHILTNSFTFAADIDYVFAETSYFARPLPEV